MESGLEGKLPIQIDVDSTGSVAPGPPLTAHRLEPCDVSPVSSSRFSSCGESELERYCSANSLMDNPSLSSSMEGFRDCVESDFGSVKSFGAGEGDALEGFSSGGRLNGLLVEDKGYILSGGLGDWDGDKEVSDGFKGDGGGPSISDEVGEGGLGCEISHNLCGDALSNGSHFTREDSQLEEGTPGGLLTRPLPETEGHDSERCIGEDEPCSAYEHSEGEESMFNYDSDDENRPANRYVRDVPNHLGVNSEIGNTLIMNTSVAFGSNDWEDFELETEEKVPASQMLFEFQESQGQSPAAETIVEEIASSSSIECQLSDDQQQDRGSSEDSIVGDNIQRAGELFESLTSCSPTIVNPIESKEPAGEAWSNISVVSKEVHVDDEAEEYLQGYAVHDIFTKPRGFTISDSKGLNSISIDGTSEEEPTSSIAKEVSASVDVTYSNSPLPKMDVLDGFPAKGELKGENVELNEVNELSLMSSVYEMNNRSIPDSLNLTEDRGKGKTSDVNQFYEEVVNDMEEILMDSNETLVGHLSQNNTTLHSLQQSLLRDGGPTASTSDLNNGYPLIHQPLKIDGIEVVGAKQKKGDIPLSERLVGVKEHTVYVVRVWAGKDQWEVERRYRDFYTLYRKLKSLFALQGLTLPSPWSSVEHDSRKIFGNASPDVIADRSVLIQECLRSILEHKQSSGLPSSLIWFLSPPNDLPPSNTAVDEKNVSTIGKMIPLIVELQPYKSVKQLLEMQNHNCAGCHRNFYDGTSRVQEFVHAFGWGKPRLCEYTGQLFCSSCHTNDRSVLPAKVLHHWDFDEYPVSQLAKSYLDSIIDQPMLCVSAVNSLLFSKVPALLHVVGIRKKVRAMLAYVHCPFRGAINRALKSRRYILESNDFFALKDLIDLSKGAFAALPVILDTVLKKIEVHITEQCLVCCDVGVPCGARQACNDPSSLIFPFQEEEAIQRCKSCESIFHKRCFDRLLACPCGADLKDDKQKNSETKLSLRTNGSTGALRLSKNRSDLTSPRILLSRILSVGRQTPRRIDSDHVILMDSLPDTSI